MSHTAPIKKVKDKLVIDSTTGVGGKNLHQLYFLLAGQKGVYDLFTKEGTILAANIVSGQNFNFTVDGIHFDVTDFMIDASGASGKWRNNVPDRAADPRLAADSTFGSDQDGSFQAGSGPGADGDDNEDSYSTARA